MDGAPGIPFAAGAIGSFDRERVLRTASLAERASSVVHEDDRSILLLDREPIEWRGADARGLAWVDCQAWHPGPVPDWTEAARRGACGLTIAGRRRWLHSSISGLGSVYWLEDRGATYFCSRIEPLARASPRRLSIDWEAWAAILLLRHPLGRRTPFAEISRLGPLETLGRRFGRTRVHAARWPWAELEPSQGLEAAADDVTAALGEALRPLPDGLLCPLSGGRDSRLLLAALAADGRVGTALTTSDDEGEGLEERLAAPVAAALGVAHEVCLGRPEDYPRDWEERARLVEHQFADHAWLMPVVDRLAGYDSYFPDGFAIDVFFHFDSGFNPRHALDPSRPREGLLALFDTMRSRYGRPQLGLSPELREPIVAAAREQFLAATRRFEGHPSQTLLALYATRSVRGVGRYPGGLFSGVRVVAPGTNDEVVRAALSAAPLDKRESSLYAALFDRIDPRAGELPSTREVPREGPRLGRRWRSPEAIEAYRRLLGEGPLADHLSPELRTWLWAPERGELPADLRLGLESVALLHSWWRRYRDLLAPVDPGGLLG